ncbi:MAG: 2,3-bisphosphoglycerate-independent phosphoglycerate mutase [Dehalococcoidia bacterium]
MIDFPYLSELVQPTDSKIVMLIVDGLGGTPDPLYGRTELEAARVPNLDHIASQSAGGLATLVSPGVTPGSVPGHLALFGYDPLKYTVGSGAAEALGNGLDIKAGDVVARGNFATLDKQGLVEDRRAGRMDTDAARELADKIGKLKITGVQTAIGGPDGYRFALRLRGTGLDPRVSPSDPLETGVAPFDIRALDKAAAKTAKAAAQFVQKANEALKDASPANAVLLRGWEGPPKLPSFAESYGVKPVGIAAHPTYRGIARMLGMDVPETGPDFTSQMETLRSCWDDYTFFYVHYKGPGVAANDGDFQAKKHAVERLDEIIPDLLALVPDVLVVTGDHSSPSGMQRHSWHPVPFILRSKWTPAAGIHRFSEIELRGGSLGMFEAKQAMMLALAHAGKLRQFGA